MIETVEATKTNEDANRTETVIQDDSVDSSTKNYSPHSTHRTKKTMISILTQDRERYMGEIETKKEEIKTENIKKNRTQIKGKNDNMNKHKMIVPPEMVPEMQATIDHLRDIGDWESFVNYIEPLSKKYYDDYYLFGELAGGYSALGNVTKSLENAEKAYAMEPNTDVWIIYERGLALCENDRYNEAIDMFNKILRKRVKAVAFGLHGEGIKWTKTIFNDSRYLMAECLWALGDYKRARRYLKIHLTKRRRGQCSDFLKRDVMKRYNHLLKLIQESKKAK